MMETHKSKTKQDGKITIHTHCTLEELYEQIPGTEAHKQRTWRDFFERDRGGDK